jgi:transglutaminase-like putative cysteine protease
MVLTRRTVLASAACLLARRRAAAEGPAPRDRRFNLQYEATVSNIPGGAQQLYFWMPVPHDDTFQNIERLTVETPVPYTIKTGANGNQILHISKVPAGADRLPVKITFRATRRERIVRPIASRDSDMTLRVQERSAYLQPDRLVPLDDTIRKWAREVVDAAKARTDMEKARAIYNHVVATVKYDKSGTGWGRGDIYYACDNRRGNCTDFHAIFIGYSRAVSVPARFAIGFPLPGQRGEGRIAGYHCWAEFFAEGAGWVPVDASEAAKDPSRREYFFGALDENRVEFSRGRDLVLAPPQQGEPLNYFVYPYTELDGKPYTGVETTVMYRDLA